MLLPKWEAQTPQMTLGLRRLGPAKAASAHQRKLSLGEALLSEHSGHRKGEAEGKEVGSFKRQL